MASEVFPAPERSAPTMKPCALTGCAAKGATCDLPPDLPSRHVSAHLGGAFRPCQSRGPDLAGRLLWSIVGRAFPTRQPCEDAMMSRDVTPEAAERHKAK